MKNNILFADEIINQIIEILCEADGDFIEYIANKVFSKKVKYVGDSLFIYENEEE